MHSNELKRRKLIKQIAALSITPLVLPGCSWFFSNNNEKGTKAQKKSSLTLKEDFLLIGKRENDGVFEVFSLTSKSLESVSQFPKDFSPGAVVWGKNNTALITGVNSQTLLVIDASGKIISTQELDNEYLYGPALYWESKDLFVTAQIAIGPISKMGEDLKVKKEKPKPQLVFRSVKDGKESDRFALEQSINVTAMALSESDVVILETAINPNKKPAQILKYNIEEKNYIYKMLINPPYQPSVIHVRDKKCYIGLELRDGDGAYQAAPILFFDMKANKQRFLTSKSNRVSGKMLKTSSVTFSSDNKLVGFCHEKGHQITFWSHDDQKFYGMLKFESEPQYMVATKEPNEFIVALKDVPAQVVSVDFDKIEASPLSNKSVSLTQNIHSV